MSKQSTPRDRPIRLHRVVRRLREFNRIGIDPRRPRRGITRLAYTDADMAAKAALVKGFRAVGAVVYHDAIGNIFGLSRAYRPGRPLVLVGSHLDTVADGGRYDGTLGVVAGLEMLHLQREGEIPRDVPLGVVCFACEEAARFGRATLGSSYLAGELPRKSWATIREAGGASVPAKSLAQVVTEAELPQWLVPGDARPAALFPRSSGDQLLERPTVATYLELHIEQGPTLEREQLQVGLVSTIAAPSRLRVTISCQQRHSGTTPMNARKNIFSSAMAIYNRFHEYCSGLDDEELAWTLIGIQTPSAQWGTVPGKLTMDIEIRSTRKGRKGDCQRELGRIARREALRTGVAIPRPAVLTDAAPTRLDGSLRRLLEKHARRLHMRYKTMPSLAGHDAANMARICRSGMIFVPCRGGVSHHWAERIEMRDVMPGFRLLLEVLRDGSAAI